MAKRIQPLGNTRPIVRADDGKNIKEGEILETEYQLSSVFTDDIVENLYILKKNPSYLEEYKEIIDNCYVSSPISQNLSKELLYNQSNDNINKINNDIIHENKMNKSNSYISNNFNSSNKIINSNVISSIKAKYSNNNQTNDTQKNETNSIKKSELIDNKTKIQKTSNGLKKIKTNFEEI